MYREIKFMLATLLLRENYYLMNDSFYEAFYVHLDTI